MKVYFSSDSHVVCVKPVSADYAGRLGSPVVGAVSPYQNRATAAPVQGLIVVWNPAVLIARY